MNSTQSFQVKSAHFKADNLKINSHNEWDPLREIIVGSAENTMAVLTWTKPYPLSTDLLIRGYELAKNAYPQWFIDEAGEDLEALCSIFTKYGAKVFRPKVHDFSKMFATPDWCSTGYNVYNARDLHLVVGDHVIESPSPIKGRFFEAYSFYPIWYEYFQKGFKWICAPKPILNQDVLYTYYDENKPRAATREEILYKKLTNGCEEILHKLSEKEILFEAANTLRMGKDLLYSVSCSGNHAGAKWLQSILGEDYKVHTTENIYRSSHIDTTVLALRPGLVMLNSTRVNGQNCPELFRKWDKIYFEDVAPVSDEEIRFQKDIKENVGKRLKELGFETNLENMASPWVGMNFLSLDPHTVVVDDRQAALKKILERNKFTIIPVKMRHMYTLVGGIHCVTLDTVRESKLESYF